MPQPPEQTNKLLFLAPNYLLPRLIVICSIFDCNVSTVASPISSPPEITREIHSHRILEHALKLISLAWPAAVIIRSLGSGATANAAHSPNTPAAVHHIDHPPGNRLSDSTAPEFTVGTRRVHHSVYARSPAVGPSADESGCAPLCRPVRESNHPVSQLVPATGRAPGRRCSSAQLGPPMAQSIVLYEHYPI